jgi:hypothetical protein
MCGLQLLKELKDMPPVSDGAALNAGLTWLK